MNEPLLAGLVTFIAVFAKGFQHKNVIKQKYTLAFLTSYAMAACDVIAVGLVVRNGWEVIIPCGTGSALGIVLAMWIHDKFVVKGN